MAIFDGWAHPDNNGMANPRIGAPPRNVLTVSEIERLAKAGVKIEFENIKNQVLSDPPQFETLFDQRDRHGYIRALLDRWDRSQHNPQVLHDFEHVSVARTKESFHVFVVLSCGAVAHLTDTPEAYPSEALIAKLILLKKEGKRDG